MYLNSEKRNNRMKFCSFTPHLAILFSHALPFLRSFHLGVALIRVCHLIQIYIRFCADVAVLARLLPTLRHSSLRLMLVSIRIRFSFELCPFVL